MVNKDIPDNVVTAGNPCKVIMTLDTYHKKRKAAQVEEASELVRLYRERYGKEPDEKALHEFFWLFTDNDDELVDTWKKMMELVGNKKFLSRVLRTNKKIFENLKDFLNHIR